MAFTLGVTSFATYAGIWESRQPEKIIEKTRVLSIEEYVSYNDLHLNTYGRKIQVEGIDGDVYFSEKNWKKNVGEGDLVDLVVKKDFSWKNQRFQGIKVQPIRENDLITSL